MTRTTKYPAIDSRQKIAARNMTPVQNVVRALSSGRLKSELRTMAQTLQLCGAFTAQIENELKAIGMKHPTCGKDFIVSIAYMTPDFSMLHTWPFERGKEVETLDRLTGTGICCIPVGLLFEIYDPEKKARLMGAKPFLLTELVVGALKQRLESESVGIQ